MKWKTKDGEKLEISQMSTSHIENTLAMLKRNGFCSAKMFHFYMTCGEPNGEMAQVVFDKELDYWLGKTPTKYIDEFEKELENRRIT